MIIIGLVNLVNELINAKADVNSTDVSSFVNLDGHTPLMIAAANSDVKLCDTIQCRDQS